MPFSCSKMDMNNSWTSGTRSLSSPRQTYTCSFCKKDFSNAQALGGHMNIHRKDRAKLRQTSLDETVLSLDIAKGNSSQLVLQDNEVVVLDSSTEMKSSSSGGNSSKRQGNKVESRTSYSSARGSPSKRPCNTEEEVHKEQKKAAALDLELRLGPEPDKEGSKTSSTATIEFF